jgi:predicted restriction endonuclease
MERSSEYYAEQAKKRNFKKADKIIDKLSQTYDLPESVKEEARATYRRSREENMLPGRSIEEMVGGSVFVAGSQNQVPITAKEIAEVISTDDNAIINAARYIRKELGLQIDVPDYEAHIRKICEELNLPLAVKEKAIEIKSYCQDKGLASGKEGPAFAAGSVYAAASIVPDEVIKLRSDLTQQEIGDVASVSELTIRNRYQEQLEAYTESHSFNDDQEIDLETPQLYLVPVSDDWIEDFEDSVQQPFQFAGISTPEELAAIDEARIWGTTETDSQRKRTHAREMREGDFVLFYRDGEFIAGAKVDAVFEEEDLGELLWDSPKSRYIFTLDRYTESVPPTQEIFETLGYDQDRIQGFQRVAHSRVENLVGKYGSLSNMLTTDDLAIDQNTTEEIDPDESVPDLAPPKEVETKVTRKIRNTDVVRELKEKYDYRCQVCGAQRRGPDAPYAEGHHIHPLGDTPPGPDSPRNILILCPNHHTDFDYGHIEIKPESLGIIHNYDDEVDGNQLIKVDEHEIGEKFLHYHAKKYQ